MSKGKTGLIIVVFLAAMFFVFVAVLFGSSTKRQSVIDKKATLESKFDEILKYDIRIYWIGDLPADLQYLSSVIQVIPPEKVSSSNLPVKSPSFHVEEYNELGELVDEEVPIEYSRYMLIVLCGGNGGTTGVGGDSGDSGDSGNNGDREASGDGGERSNNGDSAASGDSHTSQGVLAISEDGRDALLNSVAQNGVPVLAIGDDASDFLCDVLSYHRYKNGTGSSLYYCLGAGYTQNPLSEDAVNDGGFDLASAVADFVPIAMRDYTPRR